MNKKALLSLSVSTGAYNEFVDRIIALAYEQKYRYVCVANVHMLIETYFNPEFAAVVNDADVISPDGKPLTWALRLFYNVRQDRVAGMDLLPDLLQQAESKRLPVYFYGGTNALLSQTKEFVTTRYPSLHIAGLYSPPFRTITLEEEQVIVQRINDSGARLVFVVLGCPKQEKWIVGMKGRINAVMIGVGGALPVLAGMQKRAPSWMQQAGFEWLFRLSQEPKRLFKRYAVTNTLFIYLLTKELIKMRLLRKKPAVV
ncbi:MAG: WecB/TagA/CpsF family glycosyltransferase [Chitinophagaceae bacterium]